MRARVVIRTISPSRPSHVPSTPRRQASRLSRSPKPVTPRQPAVPGYPCRLHCTLAVPQQNGRAGPDGRAKSSWHPRNSQSEREERVGQRIGSEASLPTPCVSGFSKPLRGKDNIESSPDIRPTSEIYRFLHATTLSLSSAWPEAIGERQKQTLRALLTPSCVLPVFVDRIAVLWLHFEVCKRTYARCGKDSATCQLSRIMLDKPPRPQNGSKISQQIVNTPTNLHLATLTSLAPLIFFYSYHD